MKKRKNKQKYFCETFDFTNFKVKLTQSSVTYIFNDGSFIPITSDFRNRYDKYGIVIVENIYMKFTCYEKRHLKQMFSFIAKGFNINIPK